MADTKGALHEKGLSPATLDRHRAIVSLMEELEAVDWYEQRVEAATDPELRAVLEHNRDEEKEHAAMMIEWLRRNDAGFSEHLKTYLFSTGPIREKNSGAQPATSSTADVSLGIGCLKG